MHCRIIPKHGRAKALLPSAPQRTAKSLKIASEIHCTGPFPCDVLKQRHTNTVRLGLSPPGTHPQAPHICPSSCTSSWARKRRRPSRDGNLLNLMDRPPNECRQLHPVFAAPRPSRIRPWLRSLPLFSHSWQSLTASAASSSPAGRRAR